MDKITAASMRAAKRRREAMRSLRNKGWTYARIGQLHRISRQRVQAILARP